MISRVCLKGLSWGTNTYTVQLVAMDSRGGGGGGGRQQRDSARMIRYM